MTDDSSIRRGTRNIFADLGYVDSETHLLKAGLVKRIVEITSEKNLTEDEFAELMGVSTHDVARLKRGQFRDFLVERLMATLTRLGCDVEIIVHPPGQAAAKQAKLRLHAEQAGE
jgi:predicted XRE-type DNA-binding protein